MKTYRRHLENDILTNSAVSVFHGSCDISERMSSRNAVSLGPFSSGNVICSSMHNNSTKYSTLSVFLHTQSPICLKVLI